MQSGIEEGAERRVARVDALLQRLPVPFVAAHASSGVPLSVQKVRIGRLPLSGLL
jgi:hypothetical protein